jgi:sn-glycerol 3-phosphate transport system substrate-binding protein
MSGDKSQVLNGIVDDYNNEAVASGNWPVRLQYTGTYADGINKLRLAVMAGRPPHLAQIFEIGTRQLVDSGGVIPLEDLVAGDESFGMDQMLPQVLGYYRVNGKLWSLPFATSNPVIYANGNVLTAAGFKAPPVSLPLLEEACPALSDPASGRKCLTLPLTSWLFEQAVARQGGLLLDHENGRSEAASSAVYAGVYGQLFVDFLVRLQGKGWFANTGRGWDPPVESFMAGRSALLITSTSDVFVMSQKAPFPVIVGPFPGTGLPVPAGGTVLGGNSIWTMKGKPEFEVKQAYRFLKHLASAAVQRRWHANTGYFPIRGDVIAALEAEGFYAANPNARVAIDQLLAAPDSAAARGALAGVFPELREHVENAMEEALSGKAPVDQALLRAQKKTTNALQRYRKLL